MKIRSKIKGLEFIESKKGLFGKPEQMIGCYNSFSDGYGIVGWHYTCPDCGYENRFSASDDGCGECGFSEIYVDPDDWYDYQMTLPVEKRKWNENKEQQAYK